MVSALLSALALLGAGLVMALVGLRQEQREKDAAKLRAENEARVAEMRRRMAVARSAAPASRDDLVQRLRADAEL